MVLKPVEWVEGENEFGRYAVPTSSQHRPAARGILWGQVWERETLAFMRAHAGRRDIVHAGLYFGDFLPGLSKAVGADNVIYGFEPNPENFFCARLTALLNKLPNVRLYEVGLSDRAGRRIMRVADDGVARGGVSYVVEAAPEAASPDFQEIATATIDGIVPAMADIGIIQLDIEGLEAEALRGGMKTIQRCRPILILETVLQEMVEQILMPLGYRDRGKAGCNTIYAV